jgi:hypothetical protein
MELCSLGDFCSHVQGARPNGTLVACTGVPVPEATSARLADPVRSPGSNQAQVCLLGGPLKPGEEHAAAATCCSAPHACLL